MTHLSGESLQPRPTVYRTVIMCLPQSPRKTCQVESSFLLSLLQLGRLWIGCLWSTPWTSPSGLRRTTSSVRSPTKAPRTRATWPCVPPSPGPWMKVWPCPLSDKLCVLEVKEPLPGLILCHITTWVPLITFILPLFWMGAVGGAQIFSVILHKVEACITDLTFAVHLVFCRIYWNSMESKPFLIPKWSE